MTDTNLSHKYFKIFTYICPQCRKTIRSKYEFEDYKCLKCDCKMIEIKKKNDL